MRVLAASALALVMTALATACGDPNKAAMAHDTVARYWSDVSHAKFGEAYKLLTPGVQGAVPADQYAQNMMGFLSNAANVKVDVGKPVVAEDRAVVPVTMHSPKTTAPFHVYQHLFWEDGGWHISDANGGVSHNSHP